MVSVDLLELISQASSSFRSESCIRIALFVINLATKIGDVLILLVIVRVWCSLSLKNFAVLYSFFVKNFIAIDGNVNY